MRTYYNQTLLFYYIIFNNIQYTTILTPMSTKLLILAIFCIILLSRCQQNQNEDQQTQAMPDQEDQNQSQNQSYNDDQQQEWEDTTGQGQYFQQEPSPSAGIDSLRSYMRQVTNDLRRKYNVGSLKINQLLNQIAQAHSDDMKRRNFVSHTNLQGQRIEQRAKNFGYSGRIGENIALAPLLSIAQSGFQRSPGHLKTATKADWQQMGVGIAQNGSQYLMTIVFAPRNISDSQLDNSEIYKIKNELKELIMTKNPNVHNYDENLSSIIQEWQQGNHETTLQEYIKRSGYNMNILVKPYYDTYSKNFVSWLGKTDNLAVYNNKYENFGVGVKQSGSVVEFYIVYY